MHVVVASHGHCFDGLASAALFTQLYRELNPGFVNSGGKFSYRALGYGPGGPPPAEHVFVGDSNALLDYRFHPSPALDWYFDHHRTAFASEADREQFEQRVDGGQYFYDPVCSSCAKLIERESRTQFGATLPGLDELAHWADIIDSAAFDSAEAAIDHAQPMLRLANVVEHHGDDKLIAQLVPQLLERPVSEIANGELVARLYAPLAEQRERFIGLVREHAQVLGRVVFVNLTSERLQVLAKFVTYALFPDCAYSVIVGRIGDAFKLSIGHNPWSGRPLAHDIGAICARHGGGGHAMVGGIAFSASAHEQALQVAQEIARELDDA